MDTVIISPVTSKQITAWIDKLRTSVRNWEKESDLGKKLDYKFEYLQYKGILYGILNLMGRWEDEEGEEQRYTVIRLAENLKDDLENGKQVAIDII
jgi:hypothetical protein